MQKENVEPLVKIMKNFKMAAAEQETSTGPRQLWKSSTMPLAWVDGPLCSGQGTLHCPGQGMPVGGGREDLPHPLLQGSRGKTVAPCLLTSY